MAAYRQRERDALLLLQLQREVSIPLCGLRGLQWLIKRKGDAQAQGASMAVASLLSHPSLLLNIERGRIREEREGGPGRERE
ncbi:hypothetical protein AMTRI_Chr06g195060 [Amborella trichopoda]